MENQEGRGAGPPPPRRPEEVLEEEPGNPSAASARLQGSGDLTGSGQQVQYRVLWWHLDLMVPPKFDLITNRFGPVDVVGPVQLLILLILNQ